MIVIKTWVVINLQEVGIDVICSTCKIMGKVVDRFLKEMSTKGK